jgi:hypothetical protein
MSGRTNRRRPNPDRRRALELLAGNPAGMTEAIMIANGFSVDVLADLIRDRPATVSTEGIVAGGRIIQTEPCPITTQH